MNNYSPKLPRKLSPSLTCRRASIPGKSIRWVHNSVSLPEQQDIEGRFGNPPITMFSGARFYIDVYYWLDGTTAIHQHSFTGAFQVLLGSSIHSRYSFREDKIINEHFQWAS